MCWLWCIVQRLPDCPFGLPPPPPPRKKQAPAPSRLRKRLSVWLRKLRTHHHHTRSYWESPHWCGESGENDVCVCDGGGGAGHMARARPAWPGQSGAEQGLVGGQDARHERGQGQGVWPLRDMPIAGAALATKIEWRKCYRPANTRRWCRSALWRVRRTLAHWTELTTRRFLRSGRQRT